MRAYRWTFYQFQYLFALPCKIQGANLARLPAMKLLLSTRYIEYAINYKNNIY
ncbi:hypothetical protein SAMN04488556_4045 [Halostagnicola kamekurae]|uniref:Uncharacterized protein n=1 Tax=Halostagnicola kamekurae TaxID=619731 RepID=A0A1I6US94_9EURY|nr:hypothetical protein SAMN04488556_4045 [Halostagnicola kamekurae]